MLVFLDKGIYSCTICLYFQKWTMLELLILDYSRYFAHRTSGRRPKIQNMFTVVSPGVAKPYFSHLYSSFPIRIRLLLVTLCTVF